MEGVNLNLKAVAFLMFSLSIAFVHAQPGFISLDCGGGGYNDTHGIQWTSDNLYIDSGESKALQLPAGVVLDYQMQSLRSFRQGKRNCYDLPAMSGKKYIIRASFVYGNYDGLQSQPQFEVVIDANRWESVVINSTWENVVKEAIIMARTTSINVCLARSGDDSPFISSLELRPIKGSMYNVVDYNFSLFAVVRRDWGALVSSSIRYPDDEYDRIWRGGSIGAGLVYINTTNKIDPFNTEMPSSVMSTALVTLNSSFTELYWNWNFEQIGEYYIAMYFAELEKVNVNDIREFNINIGAIRWYSKLQPSYLAATIIYSNPSYLISQLGIMRFSLDATNRSTLMPIINAWEMYRFSPLLNNGTYAGDAVAIADIVKQFNLVEWRGDPCLPQKYSWDWVDCNTDSSPRIIAVKLSGKGLNGTIPPSFANLSALLKLDLSNNNLSGPIPEVLIHLSNLTELNLADNKLTGSVPKDLADKQRNSNLNLSINGNNMDCQSDPCNGPPERRKRKNVVVWVVTVSVAAVATFTAVILVLIKKMKSNSHIPIPIPSTTGKEEATVMHVDLVKLEGCRSYSYQEVREITGDFKKQIGKGGYGPVYLGWLRDREVAVKNLSDESHQGVVEFSTEVDMLSRLHHKNLVKFIGYCSEEKNMVLIYEYMSNGDLRRCLDGQNSPEKHLDWETRLNIALDAAQGLEYLHSGCKPGIIHRDVKTSNILLNDRMEAKVADFGLSKTGPLDGATHVSTLVKGTTGYLDPEYYTTHRLTEKSDVYSFGVVLLEIISGRRPVPSTEDGGHIASWAREYLLKGDIEGIADPALGKKFKMEGMWKVAELAMACCSQRSTKRPTMSEVVLELKESMAFQYPNALNSEVTEWRSPIPPRSYSFSPENSHLSLLNPHPR